MLDTFTQLQTILDSTKTTADYGKYFSLIDYLMQVLSSEVIFF